MIEMDEPEHTNESPVAWWQLLDDSQSFVRFHYEDIQKYGSEDLKRAVEIVLGGHKPARTKGVTA